MPFRDFEPVTLIPVELEPPSEIMAIDGRTDSDFSDLFPAMQPVHLQGPLGDYRGGDPPKDSPLWYLLGGLQARRSALYKQEEANGWERTEEIRSGLSSSGLQVHLTRYIDKAYRNMLFKTGVPAESVRAILSHIFHMDEEQQDLYNLRIDNMHRMKAEVERGGEVPVTIGGYHVIELESLTPEQKREDFISQLSSHIIEAKRGLKRLRFEWMSAVAITQVLKKGVVF